MTGVTEGGYRLTAQQLIPVDPDALLAWLCRPEMMTQWIARLAQVDLLEGDPCSKGSRTSILLRTTRRWVVQYEQRLQGRIDEIGPRSLVRTYWWLETNALWYNMAAGDYIRTIAYDMSPCPAGTQLDCEVLTKGVGDPRVARHLRRKEQKSLSMSLERLSRRCHGRNPSWLRRLTDENTTDPVGQAL